MDTHVKILAAFHLIAGVLGLIVSLMIMLLFGGAAGITAMAATNEPDAWLAVPIVALVGSMIVILIFILSIPGIIAGIGLLKRRPWARILTIVLSVINLLNIPFGTLLGIYGLWIMASPDTAQLFGAAPTAAHDTASLPPAT
jgi:hypothetical protein